MWCLFCFVFSILFSVVLNWPQIFKQKNTSCEDLITFNGPRAEIWIKWGIWYSFSRRMNLYTKNIFPSCCCLWYKLGTIELPSSVWQVNFRVSQDYRELWRWEISTKEVPDLFTFPDFIFLLSDPILSFVFLKKSNLVYFLKQRILTQVK